VAVLAAAAAAVALAVPSGATAPTRPTALPMYQSIPRAVCGSGDRAETGFQGEVQEPERLAGFAGFTCNLRLLGQFQGEGASWQNAWYGHCDYYDTANNQGSGPAKTGAQKHLGTVVLDVSNPRHPRETAYLTSPGMLHPWEDLKVNAKRKLLAGQLTGGAPFDVYDISRNCAHPTLLASVPMPNNGHEGEWEPDGRTYWGSSTSEYHAIDVTDPTHPKQLLSWTTPNGMTHGMSFSADGNRAYVVEMGSGNGNTQDGLYILDVSDVQHRRPHPHVRVISHLTWGDGSYAQATIPITIRGRKYLVFFDELGSGGLAHQTNYGCAAGTIPFGVPRIIDITNERHPTVISKLTLQTDDPSNCEIATQETADQAIFAYDSHYCSVDRLVNTTALACGYFNSGIRVFDIRNPAKPREIAYFDPPNHIAQQNSLPGSEHIGSKEADWCSSRSRFFHAPDGTWQLWVQCQDSGFMALQFTHDAYPLRRA
jgi:hypothetical protein